MRYDISIQCSFDRRIPLSDVTRLKYHECNSPAIFTRGGACDLLATCKTFPTGTLKSLRLELIGFEATKWRRLMAIWGKDCRESEKFRHMKHESILAHCRYPYRVLFFTGSEWLRCASVIRIPPVHFAHGNFPARANEFSLENSSNLRLKGGIL